MFSNEKDSGKKRGTSAPCMLSDGMQVTGDVVCDGEVQIDGALLGDIRCGKLIVGQTGKITGSVIADECLIQGEIVGQIKANSVTLSRSSRVQGDVVHETLAIEPGARLDGHMRRIETIDGDDPKLDLVVTDFDRETG